MKLSRHFGWKTAGIVICCLASANSGWAQQIAEDGTLSTNITSADGLNFTITDGTQLGNNLFHSFSLFSVPTGGSAFFNNSLDIRNIIGRVTGDSISNIDGLLRSNGTANLFLLNPKGILFGPNAQLNIGGSFLASTATAVTFADGTLFSATIPSSPPLLTISVPIGLQYGSTASGIQVQGSTLAVQPDRTLALVGGNLAVEDSTLTAPSGRVELGAVSGAGTVGLNLADNQIRLNFPDSIGRADVSLTNGTLVSTSAQGSGDIQLVGRQIQLQDSRVEAITLGAEPGGNLTVNASESVELYGSDAGGTFANGLFAETQGEGDAGNIAISTGQLRVEGEARISAATFGAGAGGNLTVNATDLIELIGAESNDIKLFTGLLTDTESSGAAGDLMIQSRRLIVRNGAQVSAATFSSGDGGNLTVNASESVELYGVTPSDFLPSGLFTAVQPEALGDAGDLTVNTQRLIVQDGAQIFAGAGAGNGGKLTVNAAESIELIGVSPIGLFPSGLFTSVNPDATGDAGDLTVNTSQLIIRDGAQIFAGTRGGGNGGKLTVNAAESIELIGVAPSIFAPSGIFTAVSPPSTAKAGDLTVNTQELVVRDGAQIAAAAFGEGTGGNLTVNASESVELIGKGPVRLNPFDPTQTRQDPSGLLSSAGGAGNSGNVTVNAKRLIVRDGAELAVNNQGSGNAGNLEINADSLLLDNQGTLTAETASGEGGNINLQVQDLLLMRRNSLISAQAGGTGNGGNINIDTTFLVALENSDIIANAVKGRGGNIQITAQGIFGTEFREQLTPESDITASSEFGVDGVVEIKTPEVDPNQGLATLPQEVIDVTQLVAQGCGAGGGLESSEFIVTGRGGLPPTPSGTIPSDTVLVDLGTTPVQSARNNPAKPISTHSTEPSAAPIVEAQGWMINAEGQVVLTAQAPTVTPQATWQTFATCHQKDTQVSTQPSE
ncbi:MAG: S-layer family protein [Cyanobacteriota bacterium]